MIVKNYKTRLTKDEVASRLNELFNEKMLFGKKRYEGYVAGDRFKIQDSFVTSSKAPPLIEGRMKSGDSKLEIEVSFKPTDGLKFRFSVSVLILILGIPFVIFESSDSLISMLESFAYVLVFSLFWALIVFLNARESFKRAMENLEGLLGLYENTEEPT